MKKSKIIMICEECYSRNYSYDRSTVPKPNKLTLNKYCPKCKKHTIHKETR